MPRLLLFAFFLLGSVRAAWAADQVPIPAQPVDPNQAIPAQPVEKAVPAHPGAPANTPPSVPAPAVSVSIIADSSLRGVLQELAQAWADSQPDNPKMALTLTNAGTLRARLQADQEWDVVIGADADDLKTMTYKGLLVPDGQRPLARNTLVLYGRKALVKDEDPDWFDLVGIEWKKVALGNPDLVASGRVARRALQKHGLFDEDHQVIYTKAATEALALQVVERDQADAVFVYRSDLAGVQLPGFEVFPLDTTEAPPVFYIAAVGRLAKNPGGAAAFINFCGSEAAREIWTRHGFETN